MTRWFAVEVGLDQRPERRAVRVDDGGAADHPEEGADARLDGHAVVGHQAELALGVGFIEDFEVPGPVSDLLLKGDTDDAPVAEPYRSIQYS